MKRRSWPIIVLSFMLVTSIPLAGVVLSDQDVAVSSLLLIIDASGSMWGQIEGENKIVIARRVLSELVDGLAENSEVGVIAYGHRRKGDCDDIQTVVPMGPLDKGALKQTVNALNPKGKTPITKSIEQAIASLQERDHGTTVILVSDGLETCGGDPCAAVRAAKQDGVNFVMHVVGFDVAGEDVSQLECAAQAGEGMFLSAENAGELSSALEKAVAMPADFPTGQLAVKVIADGKLFDAAIEVSHAQSGEEAGGGRTYRSPNTNPRRIHLPDGTFKVKVQAVGLKGDVVRGFDIEIKNGSTVENTVDFSTGELQIGVTRNGELSDAVYSIRVPNTEEETARGRTYKSTSSNPSKVRLTSGTYEVLVSSVEMSSKDRAQLGKITVDPGGSALVSHDFASGTLRVGTRRGGDLVDATLQIVHLGSGKSVGQGRTYTSSSSNPKTFILPPGEYRVEVREIRGERRQITVKLAQGEVVERMVDPSGDN